MMSKVIFILSILWIAAPAWLYSQEQAIQIALPDTTGDQNSNILLPIRTSDLTNRDIVSYQTTITFDSTILIAVAASSVGSLSQAWGSPTVNIQESGQISVGAFGTTALSGSGTLVFIEFKIIGQPLSSTNLSFSSFIFNSGEPQANAQNGQLTVTNPVPIELAAFYIEQHKNRSVLVWQTRSETNNYGFEIEKSRDGIEFIKQGFVRGNGTSTLLQSYQFEIQNTDAFRYFRLKQIDTDGSFTYSKVISAATPFYFALLPNYPNPFNSKTAIEFILPFDSKVHVEIYSGAGKKVRTLLIDYYAKGSYRVIWNGRNDFGRDVSSGYYICRLWVNDQSISRGITLLR